MVADYILWHVWQAPVWIIKLAINMQRWLIRFFSIPVMVRTLFAHWHKDAIEYKAGTISGYVTIFAWNQISRAIGFVVRFTMLIAWAIIATIVLLAGIGALVLFVLWPFLALAALIAAIVMALS